LVVTTLFFNVVIQARVGRYYNIITAIGEQIYFIKSSLC